MAVAAAARLPACGSWRRGQVRGRGLARILRLSSSGSQGDGNKRPPSATPWQLPLCERPVAQTAALSEVLAWRRSALLLSERAAAHFQGPDAPSGEELAVELDWLLEDAVAEAEEPESRLGSGSAWRPASWPELKREAAMTAELDLGRRKVGLRSDLPSLSSAWASRLHERVPLQYLTGSAHWRDYVFLVGQGVLIPRAETEQLVDLALDAAFEGRSQSSSEDEEGSSNLWVDIGTGSGALAVALARELPGSAAVIAIDKSAEAAKYAQENVRRHAVEPQVSVRIGELLAPLRPGERGRVRGVLSNPPYIPSDDVPGLQLEVSRHEPWTALDGGLGPGTDVLRAIAEEASAVLAPGGFIALETGGGQQPALVARALRELAFQDVGVCKDLFGVPRFVSGFKSSGSGSKEEGGGA